MGPNGIHCRMADRSNACDVLLSLGLAAVLHGKGEMANSDDRHRTVDGHARGCHISNSGYMCHTVAGKFIGGHD